MQTLESSWDLIGDREIRMDFLDYSVNSYNEGSPFVVNKEIRYLKLQAMECNKQCALRLQLFENSYISSPNTRAINAMVTSDMERIGNKVTMPSSLEVWSCPRYSS